MIISASMFKSHIFRVALFSISVGVAVTTVEAIVRAYYDVIPAEKPFESFTIGTLLALLICFSRSKCVASLLTIFIGCVYMIQFGSLATYGYFISPIKLWLLFEKFLEVIDSGKDSTRHNLVAFLSASVIIGLYLLILIKLRSKEKSYYWVSAIAIISIVFYPIKQISNRDNLLGIKPYNEHSAFKSALYTIGHFSAHTIPQELLGNSKVEIHVRKAPTIIAEPKIQNIVLVMGESLSASYMSALGFEKETTPWLNAQAQRPDRYLGAAFSGGLYTDVSLPFFFQSVIKPNGTRQIAQENASLFRMAKAQGYDTHFYSAQANYALSLTSMIGRKWIDHYDDSFSITQDGREDVLDIELLQWLKQIDLSKKNFIVLHQVGSHMPYASRTPKTFKRFGEGAYNEYLNSIYYTDFLLSQLQDYLQTNSPEEWAFIMTSDHGQYVTEKASGHGGFDTPSNYTVPVYIASNNHSVTLLAKNKLGKCSYSFHVQLADYISYQLGYDYEEQTTCSEGFVSGGSRTGDSGYLKIKQNGDSISKEIIY